MSLHDLDSYYIKCISSLHSLAPMGETGVLQQNLEEAIKTKTGIMKDFTSVIACATYSTVDEIRMGPSSICLGSMEETKTASSSDNELELDLFNEDLMCIVCNGMDVGARNRLLECSECHSLFHQECHQPTVTAIQLEEGWICQRCKDNSKKMKKSNSSPSSSSSSSGSKPSSKHSSPSRRPASHKTSVPSGSVYKSTSKSLSKTHSSSNISSSKSSVTPNIHIISADKRLQIMKKKAAKLHEKRKLPR